MKHLGAIRTLSFLLGIGRWGFSAPLPEEEQSTVIVETQRTPEVESTSHAASQIETADLVGTGQSISDVVEQVPGVHLRRFGGMGGLTSIAIRGLGMNYVNVIVDNSPLLQTGVGGVDLNLLPLSHIQRIEVYRGGGPIQFDSPIGGVVRIITRIPKGDTEIEGHLGAGTEQSRSAHVGSSGTLASTTIRYHALVHYFGTEGDFNFWNDNNTPYNDDDDFRAKREQNASNTASALITLQGEVFQQSLWSLSANGSWKQSQVPGPHLQFGVTPPDANARDRGITVSGELREIQNATGTLKGSAQFNLAHSERHFVSDGALFGFDVRTIESTLTRGELRGQLNYTPASYHQIHLAFGVDFESMRQQSDVKRDVGIAANFERKESRPFLGLEFPTSVSPTLEIIPALRVDTQLSESSLTKSINSTSASPRLGFILRKEAFRLRGNVGRYHRFPTPMERFGDGLRIAPSPLLQPESGFLADINLTIPIGNKVQIDLSGFTTHADGLIAMLPTSQRYIRAHNLMDQKIKGIESHIQANYRWLEGSLAYTFLKAEGPKGTHTPGIPRHRIDSSLSFASHGFKASYLPSYQSQIFLDPDNLLALPPRILHNALLSFDWESLNLTFKLAAHNLGNEQIAEVQLPNQVGGRVTQADFLGYPLAGRSFFGSVGWKY